MLCPLRLYHTFEVILSGLLLVCRYHTYFSPMLSADKSTPLLVRVCIASDYVITQHKVLSLTRRFYAFVAPTIIPVWDKATDLIYLFGQVVVRDPLAQWLFSGGRTSLIISAIVVLRQNRLLSSVHLYFFWRLFLHFCAQARHTFLRYANSMVCLFLLTRGRHP